MTRVLIGLVAMWGLAIAPAFAASRNPEITVVRDGETRTVTLRAAGLLTTQTLTPTRVNVRIATPEDEVQFVADLSGRVSVQRAGQRHAFGVRSATHEDHRTFTRILANSQALTAFDALMESAWGSTEVATVFRSARVVMRTLQTDYTAMEFVTASRAISNPSIVPVRQRLGPSQCWNTYSRDVVLFTHELEYCLGSVSSQWWNPLATAWCAYEYNVKSSLAGIWLLDCFGLGL
jgi:hypothetical protein